MDKKFFTLIRLLLLTVILLGVMPSFAQSVDDQYQKAIESADAYFEKEDYLNAKASYQVASQLKPDEQYPKDRLRESINLLRVQMEKMAEFNDKMGSYMAEAHTGHGWGHTGKVYKSAEKERERAQAREDYNLAMSKRRHRNAAKAAKAQKLSEALGGLLGGMGPMGDAMSMLGGSMGGKAGGIASGMGKGMSAIGKLGG